MKKLNIVVVLVIFLALLGACGTPSTVQETVAERNRVLGIRDASSNFFEAQQILEIEEWKDQPGKVVNLYLFDPVKGGLLVPPIQCKGVPVSSTESLEPNSGGSDWDHWSSSGDSYTPFLVPVDGADIFTYEMAGKDGTHGDPVAFRACLSYEGHYYDFAAMAGIPYLVTSATYTFPDPTVQRDIETELRIKQLEVVIERGGCVDFDTLQEVPCTDTPEIQNSETVTN